MITPCCNKTVPKEIENAMMPCGKCVFCCEHLHINKYQFPRGTDIKEAFKQIIDGTAELSGVMPNDGALGVDREDDVCINCKEFSNCVYESTRIHSGDCIYFASSDYKEVTKGGDADD